MVLTEANNKGGSVALSSIALLQERFKQLQRVKELRQEKDLLRKLSEYDRSQRPPVTHCNPNPKTSLVTELVFLPPKPQYFYHHQLSLSLWPDLQIGSRPGDQAPSHTPPKSFFAQAPHHQMVCGSSIKFDQNPDCDIDLSLRL